RQWVLGLEVVLANGDVLELNGALEKNNTGVDLRQLFIGSEGTLGVVTAATLKLTRLPNTLDVFLFALPSLPAVLQLFEAARRRPLTLSAYEFFPAQCLERLMRHRKLSPPFAAAHPYYVLLETEGGVPDEWLSEQLSIALDATQALSPEQARALWTYRE